MRANPRYEAPCEETGGNCDWRPMPRVNAFGQPMPLTLACYVCGRDRHLHKLLRSELREPRPGLLGPAGCCGRDFAEDFEAD